MAETAEHGRLMDDIYRSQRLIYDVTRKYYLLGRDHLISNMGVRPGQTVLEVACGTGRNLASIERRYPDARLCGFDISEQMLISARHKLGNRVGLARGDARDFDPQAMFGINRFDHIVLSYSLSMIPDWEEALREARRHLTPTGTLHVVDFGDQARLPLWFKRGLRGWLAKFHVTPRDRLDATLSLMQRDGGDLDWSSLYRGYASYGRLSLG